tara:strand:+ start:3079 stop:3258 length:180 start_codon:yes stop_codon:yes gene_type:complete
MLASQIIKQECCGVGLSLCNPKAELVKKVATLENEKFLLENQIKKALVEISILKRLTNG